MIIKQILNIQFLNMVLVLFMACSGGEELKVENRNLNKPLSYSDSIWLEFAHSIEEEKIEFLLKNSLDTIECEDCLVNLDNVNWFESKFIYENHLNKLLYLDCLSDKAFSTIIEGNRLMVMYTFEWKYAEGGGYNLIFEFQKRKNEFLFAKRYFVP